MKIYTSINDIRTNIDDVNVQKFLNEYLDNVAVGIIAEYNPFHNGHLYMLNKVKEMYKDDEIILVLSGNYTQRGDVSIIDKWNKADIAKKYGVNLIVELPIIYSIQSADFFAKGALEILDSLKVDKLVFGSEIDDIDILKEIANVQINNNTFDKLVKIYSRMGYNYPTSLSLAINEITGKKVDAPNDLLGVSYIKEIIKNNYKIEPILIKRENDYHSLDISKISSGEAIRKALRKGIDVKEAVPEYTYKNLKNLHFIDDYFNLLKYKIITCKDLSIYHEVNEGIENKIRKEILNSNSYDELINKVKSKRYTYNKIKRILLYILLDITKDDMSKLNAWNYIRILGFDDKGKKYLNRVKKDSKLKIISKFERGNKLLNLELKSTKIYSIPHNEHLEEKEYKIGENYGKTYK